MIIKVGDRMNTLGSAFKKQTLVVVCSVILISLVVVSVSYSSFSNIGDVTNNVVVENFPITATYQISDEISGDLVRLSDDAGLKNSGTSFSVLNNGDIDLLYYILIEDNGSMIDPKNVRISLDSGTVYSLASLDKKDNKYVLSTGVLKKRNDVGDVSTHNIKVWASADELKNCYANLKISIDSEVATNVFSDNIITLSQSSSITSIDVVNNSGLLTDAFGNVRYFGATPDNYVKFNNELWRIVGVFNVVKNDDRVESRVKLVREENLTTMPFKISDNYVWDSNIGSVLLDYASLNKNKYFNNYLNEEAYYFGSITDASTYRASDYYDNEKSSVDAFGRDNTSGLYSAVLNISDYYYASSDEVSGNWLNNGSDYWLLNNYGNDANQAYYVDNMGKVLVDDVNISHNVRPVVFLKSTVRVVEGNGSLNNPYILE